MIVDGIDIRYTLCFCVDVSGGEVLALKRAKAPNKGLWNGLGGKIEPGESPLVNVRRELREEAGIDLPESAFLFRGIVTWNRYPGRSQSEGMVLFVARVNGELRRRSLPSSDEGYLAWLSLEWLAASENVEAADNLCHFLIDAIAGRELLRVACQYDATTLLGVCREVLPTGTIDPEGNWP